MAIVKQYQKVVATAGVAGTLYSSLDRVSKVLAIAKKTLTATEVKALNATPQTLVAAPGATKYTRVHSITVALDYSGGAFAGDNALEFRETDGSGTKVSADVTNTFLNGSADAICEVRGIETQVTRLLNKAIVVAVPVADPTGVGATSTVTFTVIYETVTPY